MAMTRPSNPRELARLLSFRHVGVIDLLRRRALAEPWGGRGTIPPAHRAVVPCFTDRDLRVSLIFTLDRGPHASGWWRNSEYETCLHLSLAGMTTGRDPQLAEVPDVERRAFAFLFFGEDATKCWNEPPAGEHDAHRTAPQSRVTWHARLLLDQQMRPIIPTGEVYDLVPFADGTSPEKVFR